MRLRNLVEKLITDDRDLSRMNPDSNSNCLYPCMEESV
jgi:hypothetical protein